MHRLHRPDTEWVEQAIQDDVDRGQLKKGSSLWGTRAFPTKASAGHKAIKRARRLVVICRELNRVTERRYFIIPSAGRIKAAVAGSRFISVGDLKEGFNQVDNEPETVTKMASECYLPQGMRFGPTKGSRDFQELVFVVIGRGLYKEWPLTGQLEDCDRSPGVLAGRPGMRWIRNRRVSQCC